MQLSNAAMQTSIDTMQPKIVQLQMTIESMESTKFWKLRNKWFDLKKILGLGQ
jgi:hypothetical protein